MAVTDPQNSLIGETTCGTLLQQLQEIWDDVGETDEERNNMLLQIEKECLEVYKKKVEQATNSRLQLLQTLSDAKIELANLLSAVGEKTVVGMPEKPARTIKDQLAAVAPALEHLCKLKEERITEFACVQSQIQKVCSEIYGDESVGLRVIDETDLSLKKLAQFQDQLRELQKEKSDRLQKVLQFVSKIHDLCAVMGENFFTTVTEVHPSLNETTALQSKSISNETLARLATTVEFLNDDKKRRLHKLQELATQLTDLWNLMDSSDQQRKLLHHVTCNMSARVDDVTTPSSLALDVIEQAEHEVQQLDKLKASKMKEIGFKKQSELEEICAQAHVEVDQDAAREKIMAMIDSGSTEPAELFADLDTQITNAKEEARSRKEILEKIEKWMLACDEEGWLEDYNRDENRYTGSRGSHINLKRAEKARIIVSKIPAMVDGMISKTKSWEKERGVKFGYDGVPLLAMLEEYSMLRQERDGEKRRIREQKKMSDQQTAEQEAVFGTKQSPVRAGQAKRSANSADVTSRRRFSLTANQIGSKSGRRDGRSSAAFSAPLSP